jgi:hypothetical protein
LATSSSSWESWRYSSISLNRRAPALPPFVSTPFFMLMEMALLDIIAGFTITTISARRDVSY